MSLSKSVSKSRTVKNLVALVCIWLCVAIALVPLIAVLFFTISKGAEKISFDFLTHSMRNIGPLDTNGGAFHSIVGTVEQVLLASLIAIPLGIGVAIYLVEIGRGRFASFVRYLVDVMTGIPSIVAGLFVFALWVLTMGMGFSGVAAGLSLFVLMLPVVIKSSEEMLKLVPNDLREASWALGVSRWRTVFNVVLPTAASGIMTGVVLAVARVTGETAPLLLTAFGYDAIRNDPTQGPQSALPLFIFSQAGSAYDVAVQRAWAGALTLVVIVILLVVIARLVARRSSSKLSQ